MRCKVIAEESAVQIIVAGTLVAATQSAPQTPDVETSIEFENIRHYLDGQLARTKSYPITAADHPIAEPDNPILQPS